MSLFSKFNNLFKTWWEPQRESHCYIFQNDKKIYYQFEYDKLIYTCKVSNSTMITNKIGYKIHSGYKLHLMKFKTETILFDNNDSDSDTSWKNFEKLEYDVQCKHILRFGKELAGEDCRHYAFQNGNRFTFKFINDDKLVMVYVVFSAGYPEDLIET